LVVVKLVSVSPGLGLRSWFLTALLHRLGKLTSSGIYDETIIPTS
jgi:hypothetical protein